MPRIVDRRERQGAFVAASLEVISSCGLDATTLRRVAEAAGCTTGALTHYFPDRLTLLVTTLRAVHVAAGRRLIRAAQNASDDVARLHCAMLEALPMDDLRKQEWRVWLAFWGALPAYPLLAQEHAARYIEWCQVLRVVLDPFCRDEDELDAELDTLVALIDGLGVRGALAQGPDYYMAAERRAIAATVDRYIRGLVTRRANRAA
jgi:AcrR family transcriptional regulator